jgi:hypothetical protein
MAEQTPQSNHAKGGVAEIARLNDWLREHLTAPGNNRVVMTSGIADLIGDISLFRNFRKRAELLRAVRDFDAFDDAIDPYGEHDLGRFRFEGTDCYWKIDLYDERFVKGSLLTACSSAASRFKAYNVTGAEERFDQHEDERTTSRMAWNRSSCDRASRRTCASPRDGAASFRLPSVVRQGSLRVP